MGEFQTAALACEALTAAIRHTLSQHHPVHTAFLHSPPTSATQPTPDLHTYNCPIIQHSAGSDDDVEADDRPIETTGDTELFKLTLPMDVSAAPQVCVCVCVVLSGA